MNDVLIYCADKRQYSYLLCNYNAILDMNNLPNYVIFNILYELIIFIISRIHCYD